MTNVIIISYLESIRSKKGHENEGNISNIEGKMEDIEGDEERQ